MHFVNTYLNKSGEMMRNPDINMIGNPLRSLITVKMLTPMSQSSKHWHNTGAQFVTLSSTTIKKQKDTSETKINRAVSGVRAARGTLDE